MVERAFVVPPRSQVGPITTGERQSMIHSSVVYGVYEKVVDRESAFEKLAARARQTGAGPAVTSPTGSASAPAQSGALGGLGGVLFGSTGPRGGRQEGLLEKMAGSAVRTVGSSLGREIIRGLLGGMFGGRKR